jgi:hypothetical protein
MATVKDDGDVEMVPRFLTYSGIERHYSLDEQSVRRMEAAGLIHFFRPTVGGRRVLVSRDELENVIRASAARLDSV